METSVKPVGVILVLYKQAHNLDLLYRSLAAQTCRNFKVYFIDNNSNDDDKNVSEKLNEQFNLNITYIKPGYNSGFAGGNNIGAKQAMAEGCNYIFFLNNDMELDKNCISELSASADVSPDAGMFAPVILYGTSSKPGMIIQEFGAAADFNSYKIHKYFTGEKFSLVKDKLMKNFNVDLISGGASFVKSEMLKKTGLWEESYFAYGDEIDLARRAGMAGIKTIAVASAIAWHNHKWVKLSKKSFYFEYYLIQRNKYLYFRKYHLTFSMLKALFIDLFKFPWRLIWFIKVCDFRLGIYYLKGILDGLLNKNGPPNNRFIEL